MSLVRWRRPHTLPTAFDEMDRLFDRYLRSPIMRAFESEDLDFGPSVDVYETEAELVVKAELPGVKKEDIELTLQEDRIVIKGETKKEEQIDEEGYHRRELRYGRFGRVIPLPTTVKQEEIQASFNDGVLTIRAPKVEEKEKGSKIDIQ